MTVWCCNEVITHAGMNAPSALLGACSGQSCPNGENRMSELETVSEESRVRSMARRRGYLVRKSRERLHVPNLDNFGDYMLIDASTNFVVLGSRFNTSLADIETYLTDE
jgi:hypothetical protein